MKAKYKGLILVVVGVLWGAVLSLSVLLCVVSCRNYGHVSLGCFRRLSPLFVALVQYANEHGGQYPDTWDQLQPFVEDKAVFLSDGRRKPGPDGWIEKWSDYVLLPGRRIDPNKPRVLVFCRPGTHSEKDIVHILYTDGDRKWKMIGSRAWNLWYTNGVATVSEAESRQSANEMPNPSP